MKEIRSIQVSTEEDSYESDNSIMESDLASLMLGAAVVLVIFGACLYARTFILVNSLIATT